MDNKQSNIKKYISRFLKIAVLVVGAILIYVGLDYLLSDDTNIKTTRNRINFHEFYNTEDVDTIFLGPSHSIMLIDANRLTEDLGESVFNQATSSQYITCSYAVLKDSYETHHIKKVYLELSPSRFCKKSGYSMTTTIITDYSKQLIPKAELITTVSDSDTYIPYALRLRRNFDPIDMISLYEIKDIVAAKSSESYQNYDGGDDYLGRGQWMKNGSMAVTSDNTSAINLGTKFADSYDVDDITNMQWTAFNNIINFCKDNDIELTFYVAPYSRYYLQQYPGYEDFIQYIRDVATENGIRLWDFNLAKNEYLDLQLGEFANLDHVNIKPVDKFTDLLEKCIEDPDGDYFYDSLDEKYTDDSEVYAVGYECSFISDGEEYEDAEDADGVVTDMKVNISAIAGSDVPCKARLYQIEVTNKDPDNYEYTVVQEVDGTQVDEYTTSFTVPYDEYSTYYKVELLDPNDDSVIYETVTKFNMK